MKRYNIRSVRRIRRAISHTIGELGQICRAKRVGAVVVLTLSLSACDNLLEVEIPGRLPADAISDPALIGILANSVQADFECAYSNFSAFVGLYTDEWMSGSSFGPGPEAIDKREQVILERGSVTCSTAIGPSTTGHYAPLHIARVQGESVFGIITEHDEADVGPDKASMLATIAAYTGYAFTALGESFCSMAIDEGSEMQPSAVLAIAETRFTTAITLATGAGATDIVNWATMGRARVRLTLGDNAGALTDASSIPAGFVKNVTHASSPGRRVNRHWGSNVDGRYWTLDPAFQGLMVSGVVDTRLIGIDEGMASHDGHSQLWTTNKFANADDPIVLASWEEAQLIMAEIQGGQDAVDAINRLRDAAAGGPLPHFVSTVAADIRAEWLEERRRVLFGQGSRLADIIRYPEFSLPSGARPYKPESSYSDTFVCLPLPFAETDGNPNL
jgi:hypothetical protein